MLLAPLKFRMPATCNAIITASPGLASGVYQLYPAGPAGEGVAAFCDFSQTPAGQEHYAARFMPYALGVRDRYPDAGALAIE